jgi:hypothetical protein
MSDVKLETSFLRLSLLALLVFAGVGTADAANKNWTGGASGNLNDWNTASNWSPAVVPGPGDDVNISGGKSYYPILATAASSSVGSLTIKAGASLTLAPGGALVTTEGGNSVAVSGTLTISGGTLTVHQDINGSGSINMSGGTLQLGHDFHLASTNFSATGGTVEWTGEVGSAGAGAFPGGTGAYQFFNVLIDSGIDPGFDNQANNFIIAGNWINNGAVTLTGKATTVTFNGTTAQIIGGSSSTTFNNLTINGAGVTLATTETVNGTLTLTSGVFTTGTNAVVLAAGGSLSGGNSASYINGSLQKVFGAGSGQSFIFPIGDASNYTPVSLASLNVTTAGSLTAKTTAGNHPSIASSGIDPAKSVNRYWTLANAGGIVVGSYNATFNFVPGDVDAGANTTNFIAARYSGSWTNATIVAQTANSTALTGLVALGDFSIGEPASTLPIAPSLTSCSIQAGGLAVLKLNGAAGRTYTIQASTNLTSWTNIGTTTMDVTGVGQFVDVNAPNFRYRLYRAMYP